MKNLIIIASSCLLVACSQGPKTETKEAGNQEQTVAAKTDSAKYYGEVITPDSAITIEEMRKLMGDKKEMTAKVTAPIQAVCKKKGCWMELTAADGSTMRVTFKDYGFFVPTDADGKTATIQGIAKIEETSVADLKEYAKDDGQSKEQIAAITEPKKELVFEATGVILQ